MTTRTLASVVVLLYRRWMCLDCCLRCAAGDALAKLAGSEDASKPKPSEPAREATKEPNFRLDGAPHTCLAVHAEQLGMSLAGCLHMIPNSKCTVWHTQFWSAQCLLTNQIRSAQCHPRPCGRGLRALRRRWQQPWDPMQTKCDRLEMRSRWPSTAANAILTTDCAITSCRMFFQQLPTGAQHKLAWQYHVQASAACPGRQADAGAVYARTRSSHWEVGVQAAQAAITHRMLPALEAHTCGADAHTAALTDFPLGFSTGGERLP